MYRSTSQLCWLQNCVFLRTWIWVCKPKCSMYMVYLPTFTKFTIKTHSQNLGEYIPYYLENLIYHSHWEFGDFTVLFVGFTHLTHNVTTGLATATNSFRLVSRRQLIMNSRQKFLPRSPESLERDLDLKRDWFLFPTGFRVAREIFWNFHPTNFWGDWWSNLTDRFFQKGWFNHHLVFFWEKHKNKGRVVIIQHSGIYIYIPADRDVRRPWNTPLVRFRSFLPGPCFGVWTASVHTLHMPKHVM